MYKATTNNRRINKADDIIARIKRRVSASDQTLNDTRVKLDQLENTTDIKDSEAMEDKTNYRAFVISEFQRINQTLENMTAESIITKDFAQSLQSNIKENLANFSEWADTVEAAIEQTNATSLDDDKKLKKAVSQLMDKVSTNQDGISSN